MEWAFAAGELATAPDLARALEPLARRFATWELTGEGAFATREGLARVRAALPSFRLRLTYHAAFREVDLAAPDPAARARHVAGLRGQLRLARELGAEAVVVHPGRRIRGLRDVGALDRAAASLRELAAVAQDLGTELRVENMPRGTDELAQEAGELGALAGRAGCGACWDLGHARTFGPPREPGPAAALVQEVHLHDNRGASDDHLPLTASSGWCVAPLRSLGRPGLQVTLEHRRAAACLASLQALDALLG